MTVKFKNKPSSQLVSNKAPHATSNPDPSLFQEKIELEDGRTIWISLPLPDRLSFVSYLSKKTFSHAGQGGPGGLAAAAVQLGEMVAAAQGVHGAGHGYFNPDGKKIAEAVLKLGARGSTVRLNVFRKSIKGDEPAFGVRVECNPRKLGKEGFLKLADVLQHASPGTLNLPGFLAQAAVTRLDVAVDIAGSTPEELLVRWKDKTKSVTYRAADQHMETLQLHRHKKPPAAPVKKAPDPLGKLELKVYDRNRQRAALGKPPTYPGVQVTRLEIVKKRPGKTFGLADIPSISDPFSNVVIRDRDNADPAGDLGAWRAYLACRTQMSASAVAQALKLDKYNAKQLEFAYMASGSKLIKAESWGLWPKGLERSGLAYFVGLATQGLKA